MVRKTLLVALAAITAVAHGQNQKAIVVSWDGAADWVVDRLLAENNLPSLARMASQGARAEYLVSGYPSKTAVGHAAIWTGTWGDVNGVTGNAVPLLPRSAHTIMETQSGFSSLALKSEPIY